MSYSPDPNAPWHDEFLRKIKAFSIHEIDNLPHSNEIDWRLVSTHCVYKFCLEDKVNGKKYNGWLTATDMNMPTRIKEYFTLWFADAVKKRN